MNQKATGAILVIGDEILKGQTVDTNSAFATKLFYSYGVKIRKVVVISDEIDEISSEVRNLSSQYNFVITSGGVGPTHDDVTYEGVAAAFDLQLELNREVAEVIQHLYPGPVNVDENPAMKMATLPRQHELLYANKNRYKKKNRSWSPTLLPIVKVRNVYIFPGIPQYFEACLKGILYSFPLAIGSVFNDTIYITLDEPEIVHILSAALSKFKGQLTLGCYPVLDKKDYCTKITLETVSAKTLSEATKFLKDKMVSEHSSEVLVEMLSSDPVEAALQVLKDNPIHHDRVKAAFQVISSCFEKYQTHEVAISFNGGKDCTILLHLVRTFLQSKNCADKLQAFFVHCPEPFPEVEEYVQQAKEKYSLELLDFSGDIKTALGSLLTKHPNIKAIFLGNRSADPYSQHLTSFQMTDEGWPQVMRVFPLLDWDYTDVWQVMLALRVPYCSLYDRGYTSLGHRRNTAPNPALRYIDENGQERYRPAYQLVDPAAERVGRGVTQSSSSTSP